MKSIFSRVNIIVVYKKSFNHNQKAMMSGAKKSVLREPINADVQKSKLDREVRLMYDAF